MKTIYDKSEQVEEELLSEEEDFINNILKKIPEDEFATANYLLIEDNSLKFLDGEISETIFMPILDHMKALIREVNDDYERAYMNLDRWTLEISICDRMLREGIKEWEEGLDYLYRFCVDKKEETLEGGIEKIYEGNRKLIINQKIEEYVNEQVIALQSKSTILTEDEEREPEKKELTPEEIKELERLIYSDVEEIITIKPDIKKEGKSDRKVKEYKECMVLSNETPVIEEKVERKESLSVRNQEIIKNTCTIKSETGTIPSENLLNKGSEEKRKEKTEKKKIVLTDIKAVTKAESENKSVKSIRKPAGLKRKAVKLETSPCETPIRRPAGTVRRAKKSR
ncbi:MAG TPA: hypothetical protein PL110_07670 [Candidatus Eremiobacteraeota bacterium]|nr:MAG: hypothetical protein BWY64_00243 [bacterium ADurb.Bin363]HPZ07975.1 hypothetical protein [Candidatus Eremiobacteraeota bacterium]